MTKQDPTREGAAVEALPDRTARPERRHDSTSTPVRELIAMHHMTQTGFARRFGIPLRTVQAWCCGERECPPYLVAMAAELLTREQ